VVTKYDPRAQVDAYRDMLDEAMRARLARWGGALFVLGPRPFGRGYTWEVLTDHGKVARVELTGEPAVYIARFDALEDHRFLLTAMERFVPDRDGALPLRVIVARLEAKALAAAWGRRTADAPAVVEWGLPNGR